MDYSSILLVTVAVLFIGVAKAGFGGGLGMLTTPLTVLAFSKLGKNPAYAIGVLLPLLCAGDAFSLWHYWGKWRKENLTYLLPGTVVGIIIGVQLIDHFTPRGVNLAIGIIAVLFVVFQLTKEKIFGWEGAFAPNHRIGVPCGLGMGVISSFAHGAGPVAALFLFPQRLPKQTYVATNILVFFWVNWLKMPFFVVDQAMVPLPLFVKHSLINADTLWMSLKLFPLVPVGVWLGVWCNRRFSEKNFVRAVLVFLFLTGLQLIFNFDLAKLFH
ncbi:MAG: sulfite exporter TauE/SafE family protein [Verrucomicrobia bacterium]|nr:sulfite exporter TauE/SafE family protein [Verrucomicrobiota bacterium]